MAQNLENLEDDDVLEALRQLGVADEDLAGAESDEKQDSDDEEVVDETLADETEPEEVVEQPKHNLSKEEKAILALKKENKQIKALLKEQQKESERLETEQRKANVVKEYRDKGYDDTTADLYASNELKIRAMEEKIALQDFKEENYEVLSKYPQARSEMKWLMDAVEKTGLTAEQICLGKYGSPLNAKDRRADEAMRGMIDDSVEDRATATMKGANRQVEQGLTQADLRNKKILEGIQGEKMSVKEFLAYKSKHNF